MQPPWNKRVRDFAIGVIAIFIGIVSVANFLNGLEFVQDGAKWTYDSFTSWQDFLTAVWSVVDPILQAFRNFFHPILLWLVGWLPFCPSRTLLDMLMVLSIAFARATTVQFNFWPLYKEAQRLKQAAFNAKFKGPNPIHDAAKLKQQQRREEEADEVEKEALSKLNVAARMTAKKIGGYHLYAVAFGLLWLATLMLLLGIDYLYQAVSNTS